MKKINGKLVEIENLENLIIVGDLHGDLRSFERIVEKWKEKNGYIIFLGDYADRGHNGLEIIENLMELKNNENVILLKGNHEDYDDRGMPSFSPCNLIYEVIEKRKSWNTYFSEKLKKFFDQLYLATTVNNSILLLHGGISSKIKSLDDLKNPSREIEEDVIWSDPSDYEGEVPNMRGAGVEFGEDITKDVLNKLGFKLLIRSHQPSLARYSPHLMHENKVITISSTNVYGGIPHYLEISGKKIQEITKNPKEIIKYTKFLG
jgi:predicted phosphodiesterase